MSEFVINHGESQNHTRSNIHQSFSLWLYWILANSVGELVGLGAVFLIATGIAPGIETYMGRIADLVIAGILIIVGTLVEGSVLGTVQWMVIQQLNKELKWLAWVNATLIGVFIAWALGSIPSTLIDFGVAGIKSTLGNTNYIGNYALVGALGLILGAAIGLPQWLLLRLYFDKSEWWVPANAIAWMVGMSLIFIGIDLASRLDQGFKTISVLVVSLLITGAVVGAIIGIALLRMIPQSSAKDNPDHYGYSID